MKILAYAEFRGIKSAREKKIDNWDIVLKSSESSTVLGRDVAEDYWPMWNRDSSQLLWVSYSPLDRIYSLSFHQIAGAKEHRVDLIGEGIEFKSGDGGFLFGHVAWADWFHPKTDTVIFPATFAGW